MVPMDASGRGVRRRDDEMLLEGAVW